MIIRFELESVVVETSIGLMLGTILIKNGMFDVAGRIVCDNGVEFLVGKRR